MYPLKKLIPFFLSAVLFVACKKENTKTTESPAAFSFKIGTTVYKIDTLRFSKLNIEGNIACINFFDGKSKDNGFRIRFTCNNQKDTFSAGNYIITNPPPGTSDLRNKVTDFQMTISNTGDPNNAVYYKTEDDFNVTILSLTGNHISGSFGGKITGGTPSPGGFGGAAYTNIRTVEITEGKFDTRFY